jgi:hypothetical protein
VRAHSGGSRPRWTRRGSSRGRVQVLDHHLGAGIERNSGAVQGVSGARQGLR